MLWWCDDDGVGGDVLAVVLGSGGEDVGEGGVAASQPASQIATNQPAR